MSYCIHNKRVFKALNVAAVLLLNGCAGAESEEEVPYPISPRTPYEEAIHTQPAGSGKKKATASASLTVKEPTQVCASTVERNEQKADGSEKNGAVVRLTEQNNFTEPILIFRLQASGTIQGSFLAVEDMVFGSAGTHPAGLYFFELQTADGQSCRIELSIGEDDAQSKKQLTVSATLPQG
ncbi:MAG: hypothetical protein RLZZ488_747 [Pseudomonadota bacterium]|jgi:hypothetical protein